MATLSYDFRVLGRTTKPRATVLHCDHCGAPLEPEPGRQQVKCRYCDAVNLIWAEAQPRAKPRPDLCEPVVSLDGGLIGHTIGHWNADNVDIRGGRVVRMVNMASDEYERR